MNITKFFRTSSLFRIIAFSLMLQQFVVNTNQLLGAEAPLPPDAVPVDQVKPFTAPAVIKGNAHERGVAYGKQFQAQIKEFLSTQIYKPFGEKLYPKADMLKYGEECGKVVRDVDPMITEEYAGIAEGAGIEFNEVILLQLHEELYHRMTLPVKHGHCTAIAVNPTDSGDKHAYLGQTWDWFTSVAGKSFLTEWQREDVSVIGYGYGGLPFGAGMNSNGIALCWTSAALRNKTQVPRVGMPSYAFISHLLNQKDIESVISEAQRIKNAGWFTFVVNDSEGNIVNIEGSPQGVEIERSSKFIVRADYGSKKKQAEARKVIKDWEPQSRCAVLEKHLISTAGKNDREQIQKYIQDPKFGVASRSHPRNKSIDVMLFDITAKKAYVTRGPYYGIDWRQYGFSNDK